MGLMADSLAIDWNQRHTIFSIGVLTVLFGMDTTVLIPLVRKLTRKLFIIPVVCALNMLSLLMLIINVTNSCHS